MNVLLDIYLRIALMRSPPQVLPASRFLLGLVLILHWVCGVALTLFTEPLGKALFNSLLGTLIMVALVHGILALHGRAGRVVQTLSAIAGCEALIGLLAIPVTAWFYADGVAKDLAALFSLLLLGWNVAIVAHILRHALSTTQLAGFIYAMAYMLFSIGVAGLITPGGA